MPQFPQGYRAVVFGASGGIGAAVVDRLAADPRCGDVIALSRRSTPPVDLRDEDSIRNAAEIIGGPLHLLFDATGILHDGDMQPEKSLSAFDPAAAARLFAVNATGPLLLLKHFHRLMPRTEPSAFATLSARVGSISDNHLGGWYSYRASKAALNMGMRTAAIEIARKWPHAVLLALHPGTVATGLSKPFAGSRDLLTPAQSADMLLSVIAGTDETQSGSFLAYEGMDIPW